MPKATTTRKELIDRLNEDLSREYQAIIAYVVYSQVLKGPEYMNIAGELEKHAGQELQHALTLSKHIDYLGGMPTVTPQPVKQSKKAHDISRGSPGRHDSRLPRRLRQCEELTSFGIAEDIREILRHEHEHLTDLATALGEDAPDLSV
jgi:bacterioferritin